MQLHDRVNSLLRIGEKKIKEKNRGQEGYNPNRAEGIHSISYIKSARGVVNRLGEKCKELGVNVKLSTVWADGGLGGVELAKEVVNLCENKNDFTFSYQDDLTIKEKINAVATKVYGADGVMFTPDAEKQIEKLVELGFSSLPVCIAKTQYSFSDDMSLLGAPIGFMITVRQVKVSAGAGFIVVLTGNIMTMPGLPKVPAAEKIDVDESGKISGLF